MSGARHVVIVQLELAELAELARAATTPELRALWTLRRDQVERDPASAAWVTGLVRDPTEHLIVGYAGYHGPPDSRGMVEIGYEIAAPYRRRGYARGAIAAMLARAAREPAVRVVRACAAPTNAASLALLAEHGFVRVGEHVDDEDGLELIFERPS